MSSPAGAADRANPECTLRYDGRAIVAYNEAPDSLMVASSTDAGAFSTPVRANDGLPGAFFDGAHPIVSGPFGFMYGLYETIDSGELDLVLLLSFDGFSFSGRTDVRSTTINATFPSFAVSGDGYPRIVYSGWDGRGYDAYETHIERDGDTARFSPAARIAATTAVDTITATAILSDGTLLVVIEEWSDGDADLLLFRSSAAGFESPRRVNDVTGRARVGYGTFLVADENDSVFVVWSDVRDDPYGDLYYDASFDGGRSFGTDMRLPSSTSRAQADPSLAAAPGGGVVATWMDSRGSDYDVRWRRVGAGGEIIGEDEVASVEPGGDQENPCVAVAPNDMILFAWRDYRDESWPNIYARFVEP